MDVHHGKDRQLRRLASAAAQRLKESSIRLGSKRPRAIQYDCIIGGNTEQKKQGRYDDETPEMTAEPELEVKKKKNKSVKLTASQKKKSTYKYISLADAPNHVNKEVNIYGVRRKILFLCIFFGLCYIKVCCTRLFYDLFYRTVIPS